MSDTRLPASHDPCRRQLLKSAVGLAALRSLPAWAGEGRPDVELSLPDGLLLQLTTLPGGRA